MWEGRGGEGGGRGRGPGKKEVPPGERPARSGGRRAVGPAAGQGARRAAGPATRPGAGALASARQSRRGPPNSPAGVRMRLPAPGDCERSGRSQPRPAGLSGRIRRSRERPRRFPCSLTERSGHSRRTRQRSPPPPYSPARRPSKIDAAGPREPAPTPPNWPPTASHWPATSRRHCDRTHYNPSRSAVDPATGGLDTAGGSGAGLRSVTTSGSRHNHWADALSASVATLERRGHSVVRWSP